MRGGNVVSKLIKKIDVPLQVRKGGICPEIVEIYSDHVSCYGGIESSWFYKDFTGISTQTASVFCAFAGVVFLNAVSGQYNIKVGSAVLQDKNRINFSSGAFSYEIANNFVLALAKDIRKALEEYKLDPLAAETGNNVKQYSVADEIKKYKELLDMGAITHEEFNIKKKQILGV